MNVHVTLYTYHGVMVVVCTCIRLGLRDNEVVVVKHVYVSGMTK